MLWRDSAVMFCPFREKCLIENQYKIILTECLYPLMTHFYPEWSVHFQHQNPQDSLNGWMSMILRRISTHLNTYCMEDFRLMHSTTVIKTPKTYIFFWKKVFISPIQLHL